MQAATIDTVLNLAEKMSKDEQIIFIDLFKKRISERRRNEIAVNGKITLDAIKSKIAKFGTVVDFLNDIESEQCENYYNKKNLTIDLLYKK